MQSQLLKNSDKLHQKKSRHCLHSTGIFRMLKPQALLALTSDQERSGVHYMPNLALATTACPTMTSEPVALSE